MRASSVGKEGLTSELASLPLPLPTLPCLSVCRKIHVPGLLGSCGKACLLACSLLVGAVQYIPIKTCSDQILDANQFSPFLEMRAVGQYHGCLYLDIFACRYSLSPRIMRHIRQLSIAEEESAHSRPTARRAPKRRTICSSLNDRISNIYLCLFMTSGISAQHSTAVSWILTCFCLSVCLSSAPVAGPLK